MEKELIKTIKYKIRKNQSYDALNFIKNIPDPSNRYKAIEIMKAEALEVTPLIAVKYYDLLFSVTQEYIDKNLSDGLEAYHEASKNHLLKDENTQISIQKLYKEIFYNLRDGIKFYNNTLSLIKRTPSTTFPLPVFREFIKDAISIVGKNFNYIMKNPNITELAHLEYKTVLSLLLDMAQLQNNLSKFYMNTYGNHTLEYYTTSPQNTPLKILEVINLYAKREKILNARLERCNQEAEAKEKIAKVNEYFDIGDKLLLENNYSGAHKFYNEAKKAIQDLGLNKVQFWISYKIAGAYWAEISELYKTGKKELFKTHETLLYKLLTNITDITEYLLQQAKSYIHHRFDKELQDSNIKCSTLILEILINTLCIEKNSCKNLNEPILKWLRYNLDVVNILASNLLDHNLKEVELNLFGTKRDTYDVEELLAYYIKAVNAIEQLIPIPSKLEAKEITHTTNQPQSWEEKINNERVVEKPSAYRY
ncbi:hypothetical protein NOVO_08700 [Rickettsiales bacterium Ac37b]|nr:hypothetical protein NOVO_08700 [Rickettsiales bacterium Ac37b]